MDGWMDACVCVRECGYVCVYGTERDRERKRETEQK